MPAGVTVWLLVVHWIDLFWLIKPEFSAEHVAFGLIDIVCLIGVLGLMISAMLFVAKGRSLVAINDPYLEDGLKFENV